MDQQTQQVDGGPVAAEPDGGVPARARRLKIIAAWCTLLAVLLALFGSGLIIWHSLQADKAISRVARSAMQKALASGQMPPAAEAPGRSASFATLPVVSAAPPGSAERVGTINEEGSAVAANDLGGSGLSGVAPKARTRPPLAKAGGKTALQVKRAPVRSKALARANKLRTKGSAPRRRLAAAGVQQRLNICRDKAGDAAAACFSRACRSYARNAYICVNDEPARRR